MGHVFMEGEEGDTIGEEAGRQLRLHSFDNFIQSFALTQFIS